MATTPSSRPFPFDVREPIKSGFLKKMGKNQKSFHKRFFVIYKGFLVYYVDDTKWRYDSSRGGTLESRSGAIKLKGGRASIPPSSSKAVWHYGFVVHAPDPANKRSAYLMDATSPEERDAWVAAVEQAVTGAKS